MEVGIILLSSNDMYVDSEGKLPLRPEFDKKLLRHLCNNQVYMCSPNTRDTLPLSIITNGERATSEKYDINLGIKTLYTLPPHLLIVVRSVEHIESGKTFDLSGFVMVFQSDRLELYTQNCSISRIQGV